MFLVNLSKTWPKVQAGTADAAEVTLGDWAQITDESLEAYGDVILGIFRNEVVSAFDIDGWTRDANQRVRFTGQPSERWIHLVGSPTPGEPWVQGQARPVKALPTAVLTQGSVPVDDGPHGRRAVVDGYVLTVVEPLSAVLQVPSGGKVTVTMSPLPSE